MPSVPAGSRETVYCIAHGCTLTPAACALRQQRAGSIEFYKKTGAILDACKDCAQGRAVAADNPAMPPPRDLPRNIKRQLRGKNAADLTPEKMGMTADGKKICAAPDCPSGGAPLPLSEFSVHPSNKRPMRFCKDCMVRKMMAGRKDAPPRRATKPAAQPAESIPADAAALHPDEALSRIFSGHPDILRAVCEIARAELRTAQNQVVFAVRDYLSRHPSTGA